VGAVVAVFSFDKKQGKKGGKDMGGGIRHHSSQIRKGGRGITEDAPLFSAV